MIPTVDNYFVHRFKKILSAILNSVNDKDTEAYVIDEALHGYSETAREAFKKAYCIKNNKQKLPIDVLFSYPASPQQTKACYVVVRGASSENQDSGSIGNLTGGSQNIGRSAIGENIADEVGILAKDDIGFYIDTKFPILDMYNVEELDATCLDNENFERGSHKFRLASPVLFDSNIGQPLHITYVIQDTGVHKNYAGITVGYAMTEELVISAVSSNADTVRELDSLLKYILIYMRDSGLESNYYQLPKIKSDSLSELDFSKQADSKVYIINTTVTYETTYQVSKDSATRIKEIMYNVNSKQEEVKGL